jgi:hypothetical protein
MVGGDSQSRVEVQTMGIHPVDADSRVEVELVASDSARFIE